MAKLMSVSPPEAQAQIPAVAVDLVPFTALSNLLLLLHAADEEENTEKLQRLIISLSSIYDVDVMIGSISVKRTVKCTVHCMGYIETSKR